MILEQIIIFFTCLNLMSNLVSLGYSFKIAKQKNSSTFTWGIMSCFLTVTALITGHGIYFIQGLLPQVNGPFANLLLLRFSLAALANCLLMWALMRIYYSLVARS